MKKIAFYVFVLFAFCALLGSQYQFTTVHAQDDGSKSDETFRQQIQAGDDAGLARIIRKFTDRSPETVIKERTPEGILKIDFQDGFQNVMLSKVESDGEPVAACVTSIEEANAFLGRNLDTGEPVDSTLYQTDDTAKLAARHGMNESEYEFYKNLIEEAARMRAMSPNAATLNIVNNDGAGEGFNDGTIVLPEGGNNGITLGEQRLNLFNFAAGIWGAFLDSNVPINVNSQFNPLSPCSSGGGVLGSAGTTGGYVGIPNEPFPNTIYHKALANKLNGGDVDPSNPGEIRTQFNSNIDNGCLGAGTRFYYGLNNSTPSGRVNLLIVLLHELGHGLGFASFVNGSTGALGGGIPDIYTRFMFDRTQNKYWADMTNAERQASALNTGNVLWDGQNVKIGSGFLTGGREISTGRVQLFTPNPLQSGSSISHWNTTASPNLLMEPSINAGLPLTLDLTRQQMRDIGWYRDTTADLIPDTITDVQPSGNIIFSGSNNDITWTNDGGFNRNVTIELSTDGGATFPTVIASDVPNNGSYNFTVPNIATTQGRIRVREHNFVNPIGISGADFTVTALAAVSGKVVRSTGKAVSAATISITGVNGFSRVVRANRAGNYVITDIPTGSSYDFNVSAKGLTFNNPYTFFITGNVGNLDFVANP